MEPNHTPLLSVCLITYNHAPYIRQAIEGVLMQQANFAWELIIADDFSTDGTREIVQEYAQKFPSLIKPILQTQNVGPGPNWKDLLYAPKAKYIAYFEGDDYWTDPQKLQKQVDFLEAHPDVALCHHRVQRLKEGALTEKKVVSNHSDGFEIYGIEKLTDQNPIYTSSVVFRRKVLDILPPWFFQLPVGDYPLYLFAGKLGRYAQLKEYMSVYRAQGGIWSDQSRLQKAQTLVRLLSKLHEGFADMPEIQARLLLFLLKQAEIVRQSGSTSAEEYVEAALPAIATVFPSIMQQYITLKESAANPPSFRQLKKGLGGWVKRKLGS